MKNKTGALIAAAVLLFAVACAEAPVSQQGADQAYQQLRDRYLEAEGADEKAAIARQFLERYPGSEHAPGVAGAYLYYRGHQSGAYQEAYDFVAKVRQRTDDPEFRFELGMHLIDWAEEAEREIDLEAVVTELADHRELEYSEQLDVVDAAIGMERWSLAVEHAETALDRATPEAYLADHPDREVTAEQAEERARRRRALALAPLGWARYQLGRVEEARATFARAEPTTEATYVGVPETDLYSYWGRVELAEGNAERALDLLAPDAIIGGDETAREALREAYLALRDDRPAFEEWMWAERKRLARTVDDFTLPTYDGGEFSLSSLGDRVVLLAFWFPT